MGPNYACLFVGYMEERILSTYTGFIPQLYKRYIDDIVGAASCRRDELEGFITHVHPALQFTHTISQTQIPFLDITLSVSGSRISTSVHYKDTDTHNYLDYTSSHTKHYRGIPYSQFLRLRRLCSEDDDFLQKCQEMSTFLESRGYARERVSSVTRQEALANRVRENEGRIPLVLTYHPLTSRVKHILLNNFNILMTDPVTATIFPAPPVIAHRRDLSLRDVLVHASDRSQTEIPGTFACRHPRCRTCLYASSNVHVCGPKSSTTAVNASPANQRTLYTASRAVDAPSSTMERPVELCMNVSANTFGAFKNTRVVSQSQSTLTPPVIVYQTLL